MSPRKKITPLAVSVDTDEWYTAGEAAKEMSTHSKRDVKPDYITKLGSLGKLRTKKIGARVTLYLKQDVDRYVVEPRGTKSGAAKKALARRPEEYAAQPRLAVQGLETKHTPLA